MAEHPTAGYGEGVAEPYTAHELDVVRPIITQHNRPDDPQRRLLATLDVNAAERPQVVVTAEMVEAADDRSDELDPSFYGDGRWSERMAEALTARLNREGE